MTVLSAVIVFVVGVLVGRLAHRRRVVSSHLGQLGALPQRVLPAAPPCDQLPPATASERDRRAASKELVRVVGWYRRVGEEHAEQARAHAEQARAIEQAEEELRAAGDDVTPIPPSGHRPDLVDATTSQLLAEYEGGDPFLGGLSTSGAHTSPERAFIRVGKRR